MIVAIDPKAPIYWDLISRQRLFNQCVALFARPFRSKNVRSIAGEEIEKTKQPYPDPHNHPYDFYISCPFCNKGVMEPPELVSFGDAFEDFTEE